MNNLPVLDIELVMKIVVLFAIFLYVIFTFTAFVQVRALNKLVTIESDRSSDIVQFLFLVYFIAVLSLFVFAIAIL